MATETKTIAKTVAEVSTKCVEVIRAIVDNVREGFSLKTKLAQVAVSEGKRMGLDQKGVQQMLFLSWRVARGFKSTDESEIQDFDSENRFDVSKIMALAFPKAEAELNLAIAHNSKLGMKKGRIGENRLLEVARGSITAQQAIKGDSVKKIRARKAAKNAGKVSEAMSESGVSSEKKFENSLKAIFDQDFAKELSVDTLRVITARVLDAHTKARKA